MTSRFNDNDFYTVSGEDINRYFRSFQRTANWESTEKRDLENLFYLFLETFQKQEERRNDESN